MMEFEDYNQRLRFKKALLWRRDKLQRIVKTTLKNFDPNLDLIDEELLWENITQRDTVCDIALEVAETGDMLARHRCEVCPLMCVSAAYKTYGENYAKIKRLINSPMTIDQYHEKIHDALNKIISEINHVIDTINDDLNKDHAEVDSIYDASRW